MFISLLVSLLLNANEASKKGLLQSEKIEVRVGTEIIATTDLRLIEEAIKAENPNATDSALRKMAIDAAVDQKLMTVYLQQVNYPVTDKDVDQRINSIRSSKGIQSEQSFKELLAASGLTFDRFRAEIRRQMERAQFMNVIERSTARKPDETDLKAYFKNNANQYKKNLELDLAECLIPVKGDGKEARTLAEKFVNHPETFGVCVKKYSQSPSAAKSGNIGKFRKGILPEEVEARVFHLKQGEVAMNRLPSGIQLLKVMKIKNLGPLTFQMVQDQIREHLENEMMKAELKKTLADLRTKTFIKIES